MDTRVFPPSPPPGIPLTSCHLDQAAESRELVMSCSKGFRACRRDADGRDVLQKLCCEEMRGAVHSGQRRR